MDDDKGCGCCVLGCLASLFIMVVIWFHLTSQRVAVERELQTFKEVVIKYADQEAIDKINKHYVDQQISNEKVFQLRNKGRTGETGGNGSNGESKDER